MNGPNEESNLKSNPESPHEDLQDTDVKKRKKIYKKKTVNRKQRQRIGLLGGGTQNFTEEKILFYLAVLNMFGYIFFQECLFN